MSDMHVVYTTDYILAGHDEDQPQTNRPSRAGN